MGANDLSRAHRGELFDQFQPGYNRRMFPVERRTRLIALLARIDQQSAEAARLMTDRELSDAERDRAAAHWAFLQKSLARVEVILRDIRLGSAE